MGYDHVFCSFIPRPISMLKVYVFLVIELDAFVRPLYFKQEKMHY
jgi:hypothetical protein